MTDDTTIHGDLVAPPTGDFDEDGFHLHLVTDDEDFNLRIFDIETARAMVKSVEPLKDWINDHDRERAAYDQATPEERDRVLREEEDLVAGDAVEWPYRGDGEAAREQADHLRKARKENP